MNSQSLNNQHARDRKQSEHEDVDPEMLALKSELNE